MVPEHRERLASSSSAISKDGAVESLQKRVDDVGFDAFVEDLPVGRLRVKDAVKGVAQITMRSSAGRMISTAAEDALPTIEATRRPTNGGFVGGIEDEHLFVNDFDGEEITATGLASFV